jgi:hypothetical protein
MKSLEDHEVRKSARVKEGCQVSRSQNFKSLEDWPQESRIKRITTNKAALFPLARGGEREKRRRDSGF